MATYRHHNPSPLAPTCRSVFEQSRSIKGTHRITHDQLELAHVSGTSECNPATEEHLL